MLVQNIEAQGIFKGIGFLIIWASNQPGGMCKHNFYY